MKKTLSNQEFCDLQSALTIAIKHAPKNSPEFKMALEKLNKKLWKPAVKLHMTSTHNEQAAIKARALILPKGLLKSGKCDVKKCHYEHLCSWCTRQLKNFRGER